MRIVVDTYVLISGIFLSGKPAVLADGGFTADIERVVSLEILAEYNCLVNSGSRIFGQYRGKIRISEDFNDPLPNDFWLGGNRRSCFWIRALPRGFYSRPRDSSRRRLLPVKIMGTHFC